MAQSRHKTTSFYLHIAKFTNTSLVVYIVTSLAVQKNLFVMNL